MAKNPRAYKSAKRNKELDRLKKREEKRLRRLTRDKSPEAGGEPSPGEGPSNPDASESQ